MWVPPGLEADGDGQGRRQEGKLSLERCGADLEVIRSVREGRGSSLVTIVTSDLLPDCRQKSTPRIHVVILQAVHISTSNSRKTEAQVPPGLHGDVTGQARAAVPPPCTPTETVSILTRICSP